MVEKVREADAHSLKRWVAGPITSSNPYTLGYNVAIGSISAV